MMTSTPDRKLIRLYAFAWVLGYLAVYFVFRGLLPEKSLIDAAYIQDVIGGFAKGPPSQGFEIMARLYGFLPQSMTWTIVGLFNAYVLFYIITRIRTFRGMFLLPFVLVPFVGLNLQAPTKETLVIVMSLLIVSLARRIKTEGRFFLVIVAFYAFYGAFVRDYYFLIGAVFAGYMAVLKSPAMLRWVYILPLLGILLLLPENIYLAIGDARNEVNFSVDFGEGSETRTYFMNPLVSDGMFSFLGNYAYAFAMLHFPFLKAVTLKEVVLFLNVLIYGAWMITGIVRLQGPARMLPVLFAAHVSVLTIFEPDYGSYFRHFSSVILYLLPALIYREERRAAFLHMCANEIEARPTG